MPLYADCPQKSIQLASDGNKTSATVRFSVKSVTQPNIQTNFLEGKRLLIGKFCLLDAGTAEIQLCQVLEYNKNNTVVLRNAKTHRLISNGSPLPLSRVKLIEQYGVSIYDRHKVPQELQKLSYAWKLKIRTRDKKLVNFIQVAI